MRVGKWHILGPKSHVSIASLVGRIFAVAMEIWNHECGPFWPNFAVFPLYAILELPYLHEARDLARKKWRILQQTPLSFVFAPPAHPELFNFWCDP